METVLIGGKAYQIDLSSTDLVGGEAEVVKLKLPKLGLCAVKHYKPPDHPHFASLPHEQKNARRRIAEHQHKLPALMEFAPKLPQGLVTPVEIAYDPTGKTVRGPVYPFVDNAEVLLRFGEPDYCDHQGITPELKIAILQHLLRTVIEAHGVRFYFGDFNDLNVLVQAAKRIAFIIDADSSQFGKYLCRVYTDRFVDPRLCNSELVLVKPHDELSDWYAFRVMLMQTLFCVGPFDALPKDRKQRRMSLKQRILQGIATFNDKLVRYPMHAVPFDRFPDELLHDLSRAFTTSERTVFQEKLLMDLRWTVCPQCGEGHGKTKCPSCQKAVPGIVKEKVTVHGNVKATEFFRTPGRILCATYQGNALKFLFHENDKFLREDRSAVKMGPLRSSTRYRIQGRETVFGRGNQLSVYSHGGGSVSQEFVDTYGGKLPVFDCNAQHRYWLKYGSLVREDELAPSTIGQVMQTLSQIWVGEKFGYGFYRAGHLSVGFVFDAERPGINDSVDIPPLRGHLIDSTCVFTGTRCYFLFSMREGGKTVNRCLLIRPNGFIAATAEAEEGDGSWLGTIRGKCSAGKLIFSPTDAGIVSAEPDFENKVIVERADFPDTAKFVGSKTQLFPAANGLFAVGSNNVQLLEIS